MKENIIVLIKKPNCLPTVKTIPNTLEALQSIVDGYIEVVDVRKNVVLICNEEGKILSKYQNKPNIMITVSGDVVDIIKGTAVVCGQDGEDLDDIDHNIIADIYAELCEDKLEVNFQ